MAKRKIAALVRVQSSASTCTLYCSWKAMRCPLCGIVVPADTEHTCQQPDEKDTRA